MQVFATTEIAAALLQAAVTFGLAGLFLYLHARYGKAHFLWWAVAWGLYGLRLAFILTFLWSDGWSWLYWHQVATGWTALALLWAALVFAYQSRWRPAYLGFLLFPPVWSWVAIFRLDNFMLAAGPTVAFLSLATLWTGFVFWRYRRRTGSSAAGILALTLLLWGLHHLDYPILRARGAWNPWGYYLDLLFVLAMGAGVLLLVIEELRQGIVTLSTLSGDLRRSGDPSALVADLLQRPLALRGVRGAALVRGSVAGVAPVRCVGECAAWLGDRVPEPVRAQAAEALARNQPLLRSGSQAAPGAPPFTAVLPVPRPGGGAVAGREPGDGLALVVVAELAAPFAALDDGILVAVSEQIGAALENAELYGAHRERSADLERLSGRMIRQHEEQRRRLARELHDETAQVFAGLKLQLGGLREALPAEESGRVERLLALVNAGMRSIRTVSEDLRPALLDDLGLVPALRALVSEFRGWSGLAVTFTAPETLSPLAPEAELALFRAVQEGLSNVARHAGASQVTVDLSTRTGALRLVLDDDGPGLPASDRERLGAGPAGSGRSGLFGMRERLAAQGGTLALGEAPGGGLRLDIQLPFAGDTP